MAGYLTTHVLDTSLGQPAKGLVIELYRIQGDSSRVHLKTLVTDDDGRTGEHMLSVDNFSTGVYELVFHAGDYLNATGAPPESPRFLDIVPIRFGMSEVAHYHVPLLLSRCGYTTYRGS